MIFEKIDLGQSEAIKCRSYRLLSFDIPFHYHPEVEIVYIKCGNGKLFLRDSITDFKKNDLFIFGSDTPHLFREDKSTLQNYIDIEVIHFNNELISKMSHLQEFKLINTLISESQNGIKTNVDSNQEIINLLQVIIDTNGLSRYVNLLLFLHNLKSENLVKLISNTSPISQNEGVPERLSRVIKYILNNYTTELSLTTATKIANMNKSSFCRYFKLHTRKSFSKYVNDLRIDYSIRLLLEGHLSVSEISYECGFNSVAYFIKQFKKSKKITPNKYKTAYINTD
ncbi:AraC family transcriptional regulator [Winogradskyella sp.]